MSIPHDVIEPVLVDQTEHVKGQLLQKVIIWCSGGGMPHHWRTSYFFPTDANAAPGSYGGISLDMFQPQAHEYHSSGGNNLFGSLRISPRHTNMLVSTRSAFMMTLIFKVPITVKDVVDLIVSQGRQYYMFNPAGSGCLFWQLQLLLQFVAKGWLDNTNVEQLQGYIRELSGTRGAQYVPYPPVQGQFYAPPMQF